MIEHHGPGTQQGNRIRQAFARDVRRAAMDRFEQGVALTDVRSRHDAQAANQKLEGELRTLAVRQDARLRSEQRKTWRRLERSRRRESY